MSASQAAAESLVNGLKSYQLHSTALPDVSYSSHQSRATSYPSIASSVHPSAELSISSALFLAPARSLFELE